MRMYKVILTCFLLLPLTSNPAFSGSNDRGHQDYECDFYDHGIAVSNGASMQVPYSGSGVGYVWDTKNYPKTFFAEEWPYRNEPTYQFTNEGEEWKVLDPKTGKEQIWANGKVQWTCTAIPLLNPNDFEDKSNVTVDCISSGGFGAFDVLKLDLKKMSATSVYIINNWVMVDFGQCKTLR